MINPAPVVKTDLLIVLLIIIIIIIIISAVQWVWFDD